MLIRSLVTDLILYKDNYLIMDMEAGIEPLGEATARGVDTILVVVEPGQRLIDCAERIIHMCGELGIADVKVIANKITSEEDLHFIRKAVDNIDLIASIPFMEDIRKADRIGCSALEYLNDDQRQLFADFLNRLKKPLKKCHSGLDPESSCLILLDPGS